MGCVDATGLVQKQCHCSLHHGDVKVTCSKEELSWSVQSEPGDYGSWSYRISTSQTVLSSNCSILVLPQASSSVIGGTKVNSQGQGKFKTSSPPSGDLMASVQQLEPQPSVWPLLEPINTSGLSPVWPQVSGREQVATKDMKKDPVVALIMGSCFANHRSSHGPQSKCLWPVALGNSISSLSVPALVPEHSCRILCCTMLLLHEL